MPESPDRSAPEGGWSRRRVANLSIAATLFAAVFALRLVVEDPDEPLLFLLALPIALVGFELGVLGGVAAGALGLGLLALWAALEDVDLSAVDYAVRAVTFVVVGAGIGVMSERLRDAVAAVERSNESLRHANRDLEQFASMASHDLQSPLSVVGGFTTLVRSRYAERLGDDGAKFLDYMSDSVAEMQELIDGMLEFARGGAAALELADVDAGELVDEVVSALRREHPDRDVEMVVGRLPVVHADPRRLRQVFVNLLANALKFSDDPARVEVSARRAGRCWAFDVRDRGIGVSPEDAERIFEPLQRGDTSRRGTGIGLAVCRRVVEAHGGEIGVRPAEDGQGSVFSFTLPDAGLGV